MGLVLDRIGTWLGHTLTRPTRSHGISTATPPGLLLAALKPGDVLLVEGHSRVSSAIKYLSQSTWSHAALYVGDALRRGDEGPTQRFIEADIVAGVRCVGVEEYQGLHTRICRPSGISDADCQKVIDFAIERIGLQYDLRNVFDLARYLFPTPPVPERFRRRMLTLGSGDPTRAICSTLIAQAFQTVRYPILPIMTTRSRNDPDCPMCVDEVWVMRHYSLFVPRDFDVSPYFDVIKPTLAQGFDYQALHWEDEPAPADSRPIARADAAEVES